MLKTTMMLSVGAATLWGAGALSAQTRAVAEIPFEFTAQNTTLPAGEYTISAPSVTHSLMLIRNKVTRKAILVLAPGSDKGYRRAGEMNAIAFHKVGDHYFLAEVDTEAVCGSMAPSKLERELASKGNGQAVDAVIVAALVH